MDTQHATAGGEVSPIAMIGMGCMFPGAGNLTEFWRMVRRGEDGIREVPETHWSAEDYFDPDPKRPDMTYCTRGGFLPPVAFDPTEFGIPPKILEATDSTQLLSLAVAKAALEDAGLGENRDFNRDRVSVIVGITGTQELVLPLTARLGHPIWRRALRDAGVSPDVAEQVVRRIADSYVSWQENSFPGLLGNVVAGRIANRLNLRGMNCVVDAACASSLSAVHLAMLELSTGRCDLVLAGGADTLNDIFMYMCFSKTPALSPTGDARPFSSDADGTVLGEGIGMLVLKRLADAERDGDRIYAVLRSIGTSSDGRSQSIYAPHAAGQARALQEAYRLAGFAPDKVELIEAHGTGTTVGDATEFEALRTAFGESSGRRAWCALGSVKSQIGHTKAAAGVAGLIKTALAIYHKTLPPSIKIREPNPKLNIDESPFYMSTELRPWLPRAQHPRRAGVSSFGFGGSNFHAVLEEHRTTLPAVGWDGSVQIIPLSAESTETLRSVLDGVRNAVTAGHDKTLAVAHQATLARKTFSHGAECRLIVLAEWGADVEQVLAQAGEKLDSSPDEPAWELPNAFFGTGPADGKLAFLFPGQSSQYVGMGCELACTFPELLDAISEAEAAAGTNGSRLGDLIYPRTSFGERCREEQAATLKRTDVAQPAIGAVSLGMARALERFGVRPDFVAGHSYGELVALCAAGRFDARTLHNLSRLRGRLMAEADGERGAMLAVRASFDELRHLIERESLDLVVANRNAPQQNVLSGGRESINRAAAICRERGLTARLLEVSAAFHSRLVEGALQPFRNALETVEFDHGPIGVFANSTGRRYPDESSEARTVLSEQLIRPVDFVSEVENLYTAGARSFVEVGPRAVLTALVRDILGERPHVARALDVSAGRRSATVDLARLLGQLAARGFGVDFSQWERPAAEPRKPKMIVSLVGANHRSTASPTTSSASLAAKPVAQPVQRQGVDRGDLNGEETSIGEPALGRQGRSSAGIMPAQREKQDREESSGWQGDGAASALSASGGKRVRDLNRPAGGGSTDSVNGENPETARDVAVPSADAGAAGHLSEETESHASTPAPDPETLQEALRLVSRGIAGMQSLQEQTAEAHRRFLAGQEQAHRALQLLLERQLRLIGSGPSAAMVEPAPTDRSAAVFATDSASSSPAAASTEDVSRSDERRALEVRSPTVAISHPSSEPAAPSPSPVESAASARRLPAVNPRRDDDAPPRSDIERLVIDVVCEKTGYPAEMVRLDMDIEADLGIDSIKRVEIVAALEERIPGFEGVNPEYMGGIRTLKQIVEFIQAGGEASTGAAPGSENAAPPVEPLPCDGAGPADAASSVSGLDPETFAAGLLEVVAELTGYPTDMLDTTMDLEADLGIDSIKRVEILAAVEARFPKLPPVEPDYMGSLRTLQQIVEYCTGREPSKPKPDSAWAAGEETVGRQEMGLPVDGSATDAVLPAPPSPPESQRDGRLNRRVLRPVELREASPGDMAMAPDGEIWVTDDGAGLASEIVRQLVQANTTARLIPWNCQPITADARVAGLVLVAPTSLCEGLTWNDASEEVLQSAFALIKALSGRLTEAGRRGGSLLATVSRMDGAFGTMGGDFDPAQGGLAGLTKTAAREWPHVRCRALDVARTWEDHEAAAAAVVRELRSTGPVEVGLDAGARRGLDLFPAPVAVGQPAMATGDVVVISGGGRGVTAEAAVALAERYRPTLVLLGRTVLAERDPDWLAGIEDEREIRAAVRAHDFGAEAKPKPRELKAAVRRYLAQREIRRNLERIRKAGSTVIYRTVDVCDSAATAAVLTEVRSSLGPVRGLIHGAGVIRDALIRKQTLEQFRLVFDTKVRGLRTLLEALAPEELKHVVLFSSVSARYGNQGQVAYAAANEVLNKAARRLSARLPRCRSVAINWGPWDGGMVGPALRQEFQAHGIDLIPLEAGGRCVADELGDAADEAVEIVLGACLDVPPAVQSAPQPKPSMVRAEPEWSRAFERSLDLEHHPFLHSHVLDGRPVLPAAMMMEWLTHAAMHMNPGLQFQGLDDLRVCRGVVLHGRPVLLRFYGSPPRRSGDVFDIDVELRSRSDDGGEVLHAKATVVLTARLASAPPFEPPGGLDAKPYPCEVDRAYAEILFQGPHFRGIHRIGGLSESGMIADFRTATIPNEWMSDPLRTEWLTHPRAMDSAFQMAILWCHDQLFAPSLPSYLRSYRQYRSSFPDEGVTAVLQVRDQQPHQMIGDFTFVDAGGVVARIEGYACTVDASLYDAFRRGPALGAAS